MAKGEKTGGRNFKAGNSGNPSGRPKLPEDVKAMLNLNQAEFVRNANEILSMSVAELDAVIGDQKQPVFKALIARIIKEGLMGGDHKKLEFFLDRIVGKPKQQIETEVNKKSMHFEIMNMISEIDGENN